ncbi:MAG: porphobilinogen synthase [Candidatus Methanomethyliaceae archaeon]
MPFPINRPRRLRVTQPMRSLVRETVLLADDLIYPIFVIYGRRVRRPVESMPGVYNLSVDYLVDEVAPLVELGINAVILFGIPENKDDIASGAYDDDGIVQQAIRVIKASYPNLIVITDVCLCEYTSHGHCGIVKDECVVNDLTLELLARTALSHAKAGADIVAPSDMMDGRVGAIRRILDENNYHNVAIMAYSAKYASALYGPFREAAGSTPQFGDRRSYQMDPPNAREALREIRLDLEEGADIVMVKPALAYLDVVQRVRETFDCPLATYNVSGEYAMVKAAAQNGWLDEKRVVIELLTSMRRAGADMIISYHAPDVARWLREQ